MQVSPSTTPELARQLAGLFHFIANACNRDLLPEITALDLSLTQLKALGLLEERAPALAIGELADGLGLSVAATSRAVEGLVKRGLVEREEDPDDRRVKRLRLTARGRRTVERVIAVRVAALRRVVETFTDDEREKLAAALDALGERDELRRYFPR